jgi:hypothetical protein
MKSPKSSPDKNYMDGALAKALHGNLNVLSEQSWRVLKEYFVTGTLSSKGASLLRNDLIEHKAMCRVPHSLD